MATENDLRDAMRAMAYDITPADEFAVRLVAERRRRPRVLAPTLAAAAVVGVVLVTVLLTTGSDSGPAPAASIAPPASVAGITWQLTAVAAPHDVPVGGAEYLAISPHGVLTSSTPTEVCATLTGKVRFTRHAATFDIHQEEHGCGSPRAGLTQAQVRREDSTFAALVRVLSGTLQWRSDGETLVLTRAGVGRLTFRSSALVLPGDVSTSVRARSVPAGWRMWTDKSLTVHYPPRWVATGYHGVLAPTASPTVYLSEDRLGGPCPPAGHGPTGRGGSTSCFNGSWRVPDDGIIVRWFRGDFPGPGEYQYQPGRKTTVDGRPAKVRAGAPGSCAHLTGRSIRAVIAVNRDPRDLRYASSFYGMSACIGPDAPASDLADVYTMLATVKITGN